ncbi:M50 family metallopeptidase [Magnetococcus sp. PR-3]|uniref:M50 family metallopeptidase n=1 Tax=Magnetococcus sp. PR-3 TaxID=3120355 RepID=UPI002FCE569A
MLQDPRWTLLLWLVMAVLVQAIPIIQWPFMLLESYFHELGHGLAALLTGGHFHRIELFVDGRGLATTAGGWRLLILFSGYFMAALSGTIIYLAVSLPNPKQAPRLAWLLAIIVGLSVLLWMRDVTSWMIGGSLTLLFLLAVQWGKALFVQAFLQFCGISVLVSAVQSPLYQLGQTGSDAAKLANLTFIPAIVWVLLWMATALWLLYQLWSWQGRQMHKATD